MKMGFPSRCSRIIALFLLVIMSLDHGLDGAPSCSPRSMATYKLTVNTFWTRDLFPKHYPDWRPSAQWSKIIGQSHNKSFTLFRVGEIASQGVKAFAETGRSDVFDEQKQGEGGIYDQFTAPPIKTGEGRSEVEFFMDGNHSSVSLIARIVPSPDWFIGIDGVDLCLDGNWINTITIQGDPLDAGTDNGFTFTAPNWATEPQGVIYRLTSSYPSHPAGSFFYPTLTSLPHIATFQFIKIKEYDLTEVVHHLENDSVGPSDVFQKHHMRENAPYQSDDQEAEKQRNSLSMSTTENTLMENTSVQRNPSTVTPPESELPTLLRGDKRAIMNSIVEKYRRQGNGANSAWNLQTGFLSNSSGNASLGRPNDRQRSRDGEDNLKSKQRMLTRKYRPVRDCKVSSWGEWSVCSKSCGIGEMRRRRLALAHARHGGRGCPILEEIRWCGSAHPCNKNYFQW